MAMPTQFEPSDSLEISMQDNDLLRRHLAIRLPESAAQAPPILSFERKREVDIPWKEMGGFGTPIGAIRSQFEESWGFPDGVTLQDWATAQIVNTFVRPVPAAGVFAVTDKRDQPQQFIKGYLFQFGPTRPGVVNRTYLAIEAEGATLDSTDLTPGGVDEASFLKYEAAWNKIAGLKLVFETKQDAMTYFTDFEEVDLRPAVIVRRYQELSRLLECATGIRDNVSAINKAMIDEYVKTHSNADQIEPLRERMMQLDLNVYDAQRQIDRLVADAASLGYFLFTEKGPKELKYAGNTKSIMLQPGTLYTTQRRTAFWTEYVPVRWWWLLGRPPALAVAKQETYDDYLPVDVTKDRLNEMRSRHLATGQRVFMFELTRSGFVGMDGVPLRQIMDRCRADENFRRACVVVLPVYEDSLTGQRLLVKYSVFVRPLAGMIPTMPLRISLGESLSYRISAQGTELGELMSTINLAPGEERKVTITKRFEQETTLTRTSVSIFDVNRAETTDLATEMENQSRQEREHSSKFEFSASASGSYFGCTAEASASGGTSSSLKDVSQAISKVARKASQSVSQQNRQEVSTTATSRTKIANTDETVATLRNINQGRSLNLMFYRLYNRYEGGLFLDDLRFDVLPGFEVIAGSGVYESRSYSTKQLPHVIDEFKRAGLHWSGEDREKYANLLLEAIESLLQSEYWGPEEDEQKLAGKSAFAVAVSEPGARESAVPATSVGALTFPLPRPKAMLKLKATAEGVETKQVAPAIRERAVPPSRMDRLMQLTIHSNKPMVPETLRVAAPGFYLDAIVGAQPSTEPYSEAMRGEEIRMRQAEIFLKASEGVFNEARAAQLSSTGMANTVTGVLPNESQRHMTVSVRAPLSTGEWEVLVDGEQKGAAKAIDSSRHIVEFSWDHMQSWLKERELVSKVSLYNRSSGETIGSDSKFESPLTAGQRVAAPQTGALS